MILNQFNNKLKSKSIFEKKIIYLEIIYLEIIKKSN